MDAIFEDTSVRRFIGKITKNLKEITNRNRRFIDVIGIEVYRDIIDHFKTQTGPKGKWKPWSKIYREHMIAIGKGGNNILQDRGRLRQGVQATNYRAQREGILWFNRVVYAHRHDEGTEGMPKRKFMWLSDRAMNKISEKTLKFLKE